MVINIAIKGGLGNQLFQYALGTWLKQQHKAQIFYDILPLDAEEKNLTKRSFLLDRLVNDLAFTTEATHRLFYTQQDALPVRTYKKIIRTLTNCHYIAETPAAHLNLKTSGTYYLDGYWQNAALAGAVVESLDACTDAVLKNDSYANQIAAAPQSAALHIRRGDYVTNPFINGLYGHCDAAYFLNAMKQLEEKIPVSDYFVFSDDLAWAKQNISSTRNLVFVETQYGNPVSDLYRMKSCHHQILSNSSFSCWGAYLNMHPGRMVIAPVDWTKKEKTKTLPLFQDTWILI